LCDTEVPRRCEVLDPLFTAYIFGVPELHGATRDIHRDFRRRAIFECEFLFVPLTTARHTSLLTVDYAQREILHEDSVYGFHSGSDKHARRLLYFLREHWLWKTGSMDGFPDDWHCKVVPREELPQQTDGVSCGVFACGFATLRAQGIDCYTIISHVTR
jgi:Ulp1 family protease